MSDPRTDEARADLNVLADAITSPLLDGLHDLAQALRPSTRVEVRPSDYWQVVTVDMDGTAPAPTWILARDLNRYRVTIRNVGASIAYIGSDVANMAGAVPGLILNPSDSLTLDTRAGIAAKAAGSTRLQLVCEFLLAEA